MSTRIHDTLERLERWLRQHQPAFLDAMHPGATDAELDALEHAIGCKLPEDVRAFYQWHAGMDYCDPWSAEGNFVGPASPFWGGFRPMFLEEIQEHHSDFCAHAEAAWKDPARPTFWHPAWVPFLSRGDMGQYTCVDTAGVWTGTRGQIIDFSYKWPERTIEAACLDDWLRLLVADLERGLVFEPDGQRRENAPYRHPFGYPVYRDASRHSYIPAPPVAPPTAITEPPNFGVGSRVQVSGSHPFSGQEGTVLRFESGWEAVVEFVFWERPIEVSISLELLSVVERVGVEQPEGSAQAKEWETSADAARMLDLLGPGVSVRKLWLFAVTSWRDSEGVPALPVIGQIEQVADGLSSIPDLAQSLDEFWESITDYHIMERIKRETVWLRRAVYEGAANVENLAREFKSGPEVPNRIREIFPNPFAPPRFNPAWRTSDVVGLARGIYDDRAFDRMPILADALQDAGCDNDELLNHLRDTSRTHVRGCWALDLCLGLE